MLTLRMASSKRWVASKLHVMYPSNSVHRVQEAGHRGVMEDDIDAVLVEQWRQVGRAQIGFHKREAGHLPQTGQVRLLGRVGSSR